MSTILSGAETQPGARPYLVEIDFFALSRDVIRPS
jgi:hypothetical protein